ncbi:hypothetical protein [Symbioplanes lichenis]|uniref:hypothetical protein n=1 Tax=Symbioplanes lichenis TaxID=1629072 RepID=UPI00273847E5|nr:hypothetical protein [Actinoplanes lichenis]
MHGSQGLGRVAGLAEVPDAPDGMRCWTGHVTDNPAIRVTVLLEAREELLAEFVDHVCGERDRLLAKAAEAAGLDGAWERWDPELTFRGGRAWEVRFTEAPGPTGLGLLVVLDGERVVEVDDLSEWDY